MTDVEKELQDLKDLKNLYQANAAGKVLLLIKEYILLNDHATVDDVWEEINRIFNKITTDKQFFK